MTSSIKTKKKSRNHNQKQSGGTSEKAKCDLNIDQGKMAYVSPLYTRERLLLAISKTTFFESKKMENVVTKKILKLCKDDHNPGNRKLATNIFECFQKPSSIAKILRESIINWKDENEPNKYLGNLVYFFVSIFLPAIEFYLNDDLTRNPRTFTFGTFTRLTKLSDEFDVILNASTGEEIKKNLKEVRKNPRNSMIFFKIINSGSKKK